MAFGILLLVGVENAREVIANTFHRDAQPLPADRPVATPSKAHSHAYPPPKVSRKVGDSSEQRSAMRPYKIAKARRHSDGEKITGLVFVIVSLAMLWLVPSYFSRDDSSQADVPIIQPPPSHTARKIRMDESQSGQTVLGMLTLAILLLSFALLKPGKERAVKSATSTAS